MSTNDTWMPLYIGDYLADTMHLSAEEHGAYMLLIMHYWRNGAIKNDKNSIKNIAKISTKKAEKILEFFELKDGYLFHKRIEDELRKSLENKEKQKKKTEAATAARWKKEEKTEYVTDSVTDILTESPSPSPYLLTTFVSNKERTNTNAGALEPPKKPKLNDLIFEHIEPWLSQQETRCTPITVDVKAELERFKTHFLSYDGKDKNGNAVSDWVAKFGHWLLEQQSRQKNGVKNGKAIGNNQSGQLANYGTNGSNDWDGSAAAIFAKVDRGEF